MAYILFVIGGIAGIIAMVTSITAYDVSFLSAIAIWFTTGMAVSLGGIAFATVPRAGLRNGQMVEA